MKKALIISNIVTLLIIVFLGIYSNIQTGYAEERALIAELNAQEARIQQSAAELGISEAQSYQAQAIRQMELAREELRKLQEDLETCKGKKR